MMNDNCSVVSNTLEYIKQESDQNVVDGVVYKPCVYNQETDSLCSVIFDSSSNVTYEYVTVLPEAGEEIVYLENTNEDVKVEVEDVCSENYEGDVSEVCSQQEVSHVELKARQNVPRKGLHSCKICSKTFSQVLTNLATVLKKQNFELSLYICLLGIYPRKKC